MNLTVKFFILIIGSFLIMSTVSAQETITVHKDKPYYVTGEVMWYKVYLPKFFLSHDITYKVVVSNSKGQKNDSYFVRSEGENFLEAYYKFPYDLPTDIYQFHFYALTKISKIEVPLSSFEVPFYNDLIKIGKDVNVTSAEFTSSERIPSATNSLSIRTNKENYHPGESIKIQLATTDANGNILSANYSISVIDERLIGSEWVEMTLSQSQTDQLDSEVVKFLDNNLYIIGNVTSQDGSPKRINQLGIYDGQSNEMHLARSDDNGDFALFLPGLYGQREIQFAGYVSNEARDINVILSSDQQKGIGKEITYNENVIEYLKTSRTRKKIYQFYKSLEYDLNLAKVKEEVRLAKPDKIYDISKFIAFKNVGNFFDEIISAPLKFSKKDDIITAMMFDPEGFKKFSRRGSSNSNFVFSPVFIIDGKLTKDAKHVYNMDLNGVSTIELYNSIKGITSIFGNFRNYGVVKINTTLPDVTIPASDQDDIHSFKGLQPAANFSEMKSYKADIPQFRPLVYWNSNVNSTLTQKANIVFNASDDISNFKIIVVGQTEDGQMIYGTSSFSTVLEATND